jgi:hypothetical protein
MTQRFGTTMNDTVWPFDETVVPIGEAALAQDLIDLILSVEVSGPVMSPDEIKASLEQQSWLTD